MELFKPIVGEESQHPNFKRVMLSPDSQKRVIEGWAEGFVDRDRKFVKEFQTRFNPCFWELYVFACLKELGLTVDFRFGSPDFVVASGFCRCCIECVVAENARGKQAEHGLTIESRLQNPQGPRREDIAYEASIRLANSVSAKYAKYQNRYGKLEHVQGKAFVLAVAPFEEPHFWIQRLDGITNVLYAAKLGSVRKENKTEFPLGFFLDAGMAEVSAVIFSNVATYSKVVALASDKDSVNCFVTARHGHTGLNYYTDGYSESLLDGLFVLHNPHARFPLETQQLSAKGVAQVYADGSRLVAEFPHGYLLERSCMSFQPI